ncbi:MAG: hypothetical protein ACK58L_12820 [Planctomycetota bacterium]
MNRQHPQKHPNEVDALQDQVAELKAEVRELAAQLDDQGLSHGAPHLAHRRFVRYESPAQLFGLPVISIAKGPDLSSGQKQGHAIGWIAFGDMATGVIAVGGIARGLFAVGGIAVGLFAVGGLAFGIVAGVGGIATGYFAVGGCVAGSQIAGGLRFPLG